MLHIPVSQIFIRLSVRFNPKQKTSTFDPFMDLFLYTCPLILWVLSLTVLWWLQQETPCSINTEQWLAQLPRGPVWSSACVLPFNTDKTRSVKEKASLPLLPPSPFSLCSVLYLTSLCPQHISARAEHGGESPSPSLNTLLHSKRHKRKSRQVVAAFPSHTHTQLEICFKCGVVRCRTFPTQRTNPPLRTTPQLLPAHISWSFFKEPNRKLVTSVLALWAHSHLHIHSMLLFDWEHSLSQRKIAGGVVSKELL